MIAVSTIRKLLFYNPETGDLTWKPRGLAFFKNSQAHASWNTKYSGKSPKYIGLTGYKRVKIFGKNYLAHRVAWAIYHGKWPSKCIDHINRIKSDNRIENLRDVSQETNAKNRSGESGVCFKKRNNRWVAYINKDLKQVHLGSFKCKYSAIAARKAAEEELKLGGSVL